MRHVLMSISLCHFPVNANEGRAGFRDSPGSAGACRGYLCRPGKAFAPGKEALN
ncbi:hypothetical protein NUITMVR1_24300 [Raoultella ornithinolytica]|nr:hypothetical protein NUITMVR1_24300 [Raoultella ornithinolytica]